MSTTDIATTDPALPAIPTPAANTGFGAAGLHDVILPQITLAQGQSEFLTDRSYGVRNGDVIWHTAKADLHWLIGGESGNDDSFTGFVVDAAYTPVEFDGAGGMRFIQPDEVPDFTPGSGQWRGWRYQVAIPEVDELFPASLLLTKSNLRASSQINTHARRQAAAEGVAPNLVGPVPIKFILRDATSKDGHQYFLFQCHKAVDFDEDDFAAAKNIQETARNFAAARAAENRAPQIDSGDAPSI